MSSLELAETRRDSLAVTGARRETRRIAQGSACVVEETPLSFARTVSLSNPIDIVAVSESHRTAECSNPCI